LQHHESGRRREEISLAEMETVIMHAAFNENGKTVGDIAEHYLLQAVCMKVN